jgi:hypothetical protein
VIGITKFASVHTYTWRSAPIPDIDLNHFLNVEGATRRRLNNQEKLLIVSSKKITKRLLAPVKFTIPTPSTTRKS